MAHLVLARKYRPQRFADVAGQQHVTVTLMNALTQGRIAHGYIFSGHRGIGKTTIARILAMALNCRKEIGSDLRPSAEPCEQCESCVEIRAGNAVDVIEIDAATNRGIDEIRELRDAARYRPARDRYKIYILDEAHQITDAAFNALLKTLEEPPEHIVFMMATTQPEDIPQTVRSRCQHFSFHAVKMADILTELRGIAEQEGVTAGEAALSLLAEAGDGSMRDALSIMDQAIASAPVEGGRARLDPAQIRELMGTVSNAVFERMLDAVDASRSAEVITLANELMDAGNSASQLSRQLVRYLRNCLMAKISGLTPESVGSDGNLDELLQTSPDEQRRAARTAGRFSEEELTRFLQVMLRTFDELAYRQEQRFHFELGLLKLVHLRRLLPMEEVLSRIPMGAGAAVPPPNRSLGGVVAQVGVGAGPSVVEVGESTSGVFERPAMRPKAEFSRFTRQATEAPRPVPPLARETEKPSETPLRADALLPSGAMSGLAGEVEAGRVTPEPTVRAGSESRGLEEKEGVESIAVGAELVASPAGSASRPSAESLKEMAARALAGARSQSSAADAMDEAEWTLNDECLRIQTTLSSTMLPMVVNPEAEKIVRGVVQGAAGMEAVRVDFLPGKAQLQEPVKRARRGSSGSAQAKAEQHPIVQQAQRLFHAEIRNVIDLTEGK